MDGHTQFPAYDQNSMRRDSTTGSELLHPRSDSELQELTEISLTSESKLCWQKEVLALSEELFTAISEMQKCSIPTLVSYVKRIGGCETLFEFTDFDAKLAELKQRTRESYESASSVMPEANPLPKIEFDFLRLGFCSAYASLKERIHRSQLKASAEGSNCLADSLVGLAIQIAAEEKDKFDRKQFDAATMHEKMECLYRIRVALDDPLNNENNVALGLLAERSGSKSYWWLFLGVVVLVASVVLMLATQGVGIPYLVALAKLSIAPELSTLSLLGCVGGIGMMWWQQQPNANKICCFWHLKKQQDNKDHKPEFGRSQMYVASHG